MWASNLGLWSPPAGLRGGDKTSPHQRGSRRDDDRRLRCALAPPLGFAPPSWLPASRRPCDRSLYATPNSATVSRTSTPHLRNASSVRKPVPTHPTLTRDSRSRLAIKSRAAGVRLDQ